LLLIEVDLERDRSAGIARDELVIRLAKRAIERAAREPVENERRELVAVTGALARTVREHDRSLAAGRLSAHTCSDVTRDPLLLGGDSRLVRRQQHRSVHGDAELERRAVDARLR